MWPNLTVYNGKILFFIKELCFYNANTVMAACRSKATSVQDQNYPAQYNSLYKWAYKSHFTFFCKFFYLS